MLERTALAAGTALLITGILGFVPGGSTADANGHQLLLGIFMTGLFHNVFHLGSGFTGLLAATTEKYSQWYLWIFRLVYAVLTLLGFAIGIGNANMADNILHAVVALILLGVGFGVKVKGGNSIPAQSIAEGL